MTSKLTKEHSKTFVSGPVLAIDLGQKLVGVAVSDELSITIKRLPPIKRTNWKRLLQDVRSLLEGFDAKTLVIGLPLRLDGSSGQVANDVKRLAGNFAKSLDMPVYLQDERLTSFEARENLKSEHAEDEIAGLIDGEAAAIILRDFLQSSGDRELVSPDAVIP
jgi:putative Holliday junction resolvase